MNERVTREIREAMIDARKSLIHSHSMRGDEANRSECVLSALADIQSVLDILDETELVELREEHRDLTEENTRLRAQIAAAQTDKDETLQ